jgi:hypothetical protein
MTSITIELTKEEQEKFDTVYNSIISKYTKRELRELESDNIAKFYLKNIILKYIFTNEWPTNTDIQQNIHLLPPEELQEKYNATIPLQSSNNQPVVLERSPEEIKAAYHEKLSNLQIERAKK